MPPWVLMRTALGACNLYNSANKIWMVASSAVDKTMEVYQLQYLPSVIGVSASEQSSEAIWLVDMTDSPPGP